ncbi:hypothetical protein NC651_019794 [Populus alba x Populus x berolinensis]|nr:hypothetical protein NC651_019794 [Populus alba x Populus x berolinensis]
MMERKAGTKEEEAATQRTILCLENGEAWDIDVNTRINFDQECKCLEALLASDWMFIWDVKEVAVT